MHDGLMTRFPLTVSNSIRLHQLDVFRINFPNIIVYLLLNYRQLRLPMQLFYGLHNLTQLI